MKQEQVSKTGYKSRFWSVFQKDGSIARYRDKNQAREESRRLGNGVFWEHVEWEDGHVSRRPIFIGECPSTNGPKLGYDQRDNVPAENIGPHPDEIPW